MSTSRQVGPGLKGTIKVPGDKSITHRTVLMGAISKGSTEISAANLGADVLSLIGAIGALGPQIEVDEYENTIAIEGAGWSGLHEPENPLDLGNSGTAMRSLAGLCSAIEGLSVLTGDESLRSRPMLRVVAPLRQMGAQIDGRAHGDRAPLTIRGGDLAGIEIDTKIASAQVKTALLLAGLAASGRTTVTEPGGSRDHTERIIKAAELKIDQNGPKVSLTGGQEPEAFDWEVPGDISSALFLVVAALIIPGSEILIEDVGLNPTRTAALDVLKRMGADIEIEPEDGIEWEPRGTLVARSSELTGVTIEPAEVPGLIDELPILALAATQADGKTSVRGASELRVKESDRIEGIASVLGALGQEVKTHADGFDIEGPTDLVGGTIDPMGDHRLAMTAAVAGLFTPDKVRVTNWSVVDTSFPGFAGLVAAARGKPRRGLLR